MCLEGREQLPLFRTSVRDVVAQSEELGSWWLSLWEIDRELAVRGAAIRVLTDAEFELWGGDSRIGPAFGRPGGQWIWYQGSTPPTLDVFLHGFVPAALRTGMNLPLEFARELERTLRDGVWNQDESALYRAREAAWLARHGLLARAKAAIH